MYHRRLIQITQSLRKNMSTLQKASLLFNIYTLTYTLLEIDWYT
jgi:hypothetical protein